MSTAISVTLVVKVHKKKKTKPPPHRFHIVTMSISRSGTATVVAEGLFLAVPCENGGGVLCWRFTKIKERCDSISDHHCCSEDTRLDTLAETNTGPRDAKFYQLKLANLSVLGEIALYILITADWLQTGPTPQSAFNDSTLISVNSIIRVRKPQCSWWI